MSPPAVLIDTSSSDFNPARVPPVAVTQSRTLVLCPPSIASKPESLESALANVERTSTDVQMLDRLTLNFASLPEATYSTVLLLSDPASNASSLLEKPLLEKIIASMVPGGRWRSPGKEKWVSDRLAFLTAGFLVEESPSEGLVAVKPDFGGQKSVALKLRKKPTTNASVVKPVVAAPTPAPAPPPAPVTNGNGVGFVDFTDDFGDDDELIDEDELMADEDLATPVQMRMSASRTRFGMLRLIPGSS
jgi:hypothetical protein